MVFSPPVKKSAHPDEDADEGEEFVRMAVEPQRGLLKEFWAFLRNNKKWWLVPIIVALLLVAIVVLLGGSPLAPFLYPLF